MTAVTLSDNNRFMSCHANRWNSTCNGYANGLILQAWMMSKYDSGDSIISMDIFAKIDTNGCMSNSENFRAKFSAMIYI